jgi:hypothetical protein
MSEVVAAVIGAVVGGLIAFGSAAWAFRRARDLTEREAAEARAKLVEGLLSEIAVASAIAREASSTPLPVECLGQVMTLFSRMSASQSAAFTTYAQSALRYNGRVSRIVAYGMGKRAAGQSPGAEKPEEQATNVLAAASVASRELQDFAMTLG